MVGMADGLWNWCVAQRIDDDRVRGALAGALEIGVGEIENALPGALMADVYHVGGDFPTLVDVYLAPTHIAEETVASAVAVRLRAAILLPDDTLNPTRYVLAEADGTLRPVHVTEVETDDGPERRDVRPCTGSDPACAAPAGCHSSRFRPDRDRRKQDPTPESPAAA